MDNRLRVFLLLIFSLLPFLVLAETFQGKVVGVSDGDTITVMRKGVGEKIRLNGIDAPEKSQDFGQAAKRFVSNACPLLSLRERYIRLKNLRRFLSYVVF